MTGTKPNIIAKPTAPRVRLPCNATGVSPGFKTAIVWRGTNNLQTRAT
jgi:hypothetical protein